MPDYHKRLNKADIERLKQVEDYILCNLTKELDIDTLARTFGYSRATLKRHFHKCFSETIPKYILRARMEKAKLLLGASQGTVGEIGFAVGYNSLSSFSHTFRRFYGVSPFGNGNG